MRATQLQAKISIAFPSYIYQCKNTSAFLFFKLVLNQGSPNICIIGAGPAGMAASISLSQQGIPHSLIDADHFPRHKPCGDIMPSQVIRELNRIDPAIMQTLEQRQLINPVWCTKTYPPNGKPLNIDYLPFEGKTGVPGCFSISRYDFDQVLLEKTLESPLVQFKPGTRVTALERTEVGINIKTKDETIHSNLVLIATGSSNTLLKELGHAHKPEDCAVGIRGHFKGLPIDSSVTELFLDREIMPGGLYITPLPKGLYNVNLVLSLKRVKSENLNLREVFEAYIRQNPLLKARFEKAERVGNFEGSMLFMGIRPKTLVGDHYMLLGDAAGLIEVFSGNGIPQAFMSGRFAAKVAAKSYKSLKFNSSALLDYQNDLMAKIGKSYRFGQLLYPGLHRSWASGMMLKLLNYFSSKRGANEVLRDLLYDKHPHRQLFNPKFYYRLFAG